MSALPPEADVNDYVAGCPLLTQSGSLGSQMPADCFRPRLGICRGVNSSIERPLLAPPLSLINGYQRLSYYTKQAPFLRHTLQGVHTAFRKMETRPRDQILHRGRDEHFARPRKRRYPRSNVNRDAHDIISH